MLSYDPLNNGSGMLFHVWLFQFIGVAKLWDGVNKMN